MPHNVLLEREALGRALGRVRQNRDRREHKAHEKRRDGAPHVRREDSRARGAQHDEEGNHVRVHEPERRVPAQIGQDRVRRVEDHDLTSPVVRLADAETRGRAHDRRDGVCEREPDVPSAHFWGLASSDVLAQKRRKQKQNAPQKTPQKLSFPRMEVIFKKIKKKKNHLNGHFRVSTGALQSPQKT